MQHRRLRGSGPVGLTVEVCYESWVAVVCVRGEVDSASVAKLRTAVDEAATTGHDVLIDLSACPFVDSSGLSQVLRGHQLALAHDASFAVVCVEGSIPARVLDIVSAGSIPVHPSRTDALHAMRRSAHDGGGGGTPGGGLGGTAAI